MIPSMRYQSQGEVPLGAKVTVYADGTIRMGRVMGFSPAGVHVRLTGGSRRRWYRPTDLSPRGWKARRQLKKLRKALP